jgi:hypothetical protein
MQAAPLPAPAQASAPDLPQAVGADFAADFARQLGLILAGLAAVVARRFPANPRLIVLAVPLWRRLSRLAQRAGRLFALLAAGRLPRPSRPGRAHAAGPRGPRLLPGGRWWLIRALGHEAAVYGTQLEALLATPEATRLLVQIPAARRLIAPLARLLALPAFTPIRKPRVRKPRAPKPCPAAPPVFRPTSPRPSAHWPWLARPPRKRA